jgi:DNA-binding NtrC family response regulator
MKNTVLVVEQDILVRHPLAQYLRDCGYDVIETTGEDEARKAFSRDGLRIDVVLISTQSAGESGFSLASWIRTHAPEVKVVLGGTVARSLQMAGDLCDEGHAPETPANYRPVLEGIRQQLAQRKQADEDETN